MGREDEIVKIAIATDDGKTISRHFGRARMYAVLTVQDGTVVCRELRDKSAPHWLAPAPADRAPQGGEHGTAEHGTDPAAAARHAGMFEAVSDCDCLICSLAESAIQPAPERYWVSGCRVFHGGPLLA